MECALEFQPSEVFVLYPRQDLYTCTIDLVLLFACVDKMLQSDHCKAVGFVVCFIPSLQHWLTAF